MAAAEDRDIKPARGVQPDRIPIGTVREGSTVEASARVFFDTKNAVGLAINIAPPPFVVVEDVHVGRPEEGSSGGTAFCDVFLSVETERAEDYSGHLQVQLGNQRAEVPISITVLPHEPGLTKVLVVETPFGRFSTSDASLFNPLLDIVKSLQIDINYARVLPQQLLDFDVILLAGDGLFSIKDIAPLREFVDGGGRLILAANSCFVGTVAKANAILDGYGLHIEDMEPRSLESDYRTFNLNSSKHIAIGDSLADGVEKLTFFRPSPIRVTDKSKGKILVRTPFDHNEGFVAVSRDIGEVVVLGQSLWWSWLNKGKDNAQLLQNMLAGNQLR